MEGFANFEIFEVSNAFGLVKVMNLVGGRRLDIRQSRVK